MTRDEALAALKGDVPAERLNAARYLQFWALPTDIPALRAAIANEPVGWVRRALESALVRLGDKTADIVDLDDLRKGDAETSADLAAMARARVASTVVHELEPIVGAIEYYAASEFHEFAESKTRIHIERLAGLLRAIETLGAISTNPRLERVDVSRLLAEVVEAERTAFEVSIRLEGATALVVSTDPSLLRLIVGNGIKNACESVQQVTNRSAAVTVLFGASDRELWVTVVDSGVGLPSGSTESLFEMGTSTKEDHLGMGLALSSEAARALGGQLRLISDQTSGTRLELTFPISRGNGAGTSD